MLNVIMLNVIMLNVIMLNVIMLSVIMQKVIMLNSTMLNALAPLLYFRNNMSTSFQQNQGLYTINLFTIVTNTTSW